MSWKFYTLWQAIVAADIFLRWVKKDFASGDRQELVEDWKDLKRAAVIICDTVQQIEQELSL